MNPFRLFACAILGVSFTMTSSPAEPKAPNDVTGWFAFDPTGEDEPGVIDTSAWLDTPAGKHGFVQVDGPDLRCEDGTPIKFWGTNICNQRVAPSKEDADRWSAKLAKYGINCVRFHKFTWAGGGGLGDEEVSTRLVPEEVERWDYFVHQLRRRGIYTGWSHIYGHRIQPGDADRLLAYNEVKDIGGGHLKGSSIGLVHFAEDLQDLNIELTVNMLNHLNPHTGLRNADDPALAFIELQNEDDIFFPTAHDRIMQAPTYKNLICAMFSDWLKEKYGSHEGLVEAWGERAINAYPEYQEGEHLDKRNIFPIAHSWFFGAEAIVEQGEEKGTYRRLLDTARFLYEVQDHFYQRFVQAIRDTGYKGAIVGSCWQAGDGVAHYYNLHTDYRVGIIDRHNYAGGGTGHNIAPGKIVSSAMVSSPGSGLLSTGMQAVVDRPFALSEWMSKPPNQWIAEGAPIVAVYGMGLQGWDGSYSFASNFPHYTDIINAPNSYNVDSPTQIALYPALARMVYRGDVQEGAVISTRNVHVPSLADGKIGFVETVEQDWDHKSFSGVVPQEALAAGRVVLEFTDEPKETAPPDLSGLWDKADKLVRSETGQLRWDYSGDGYFTVDTPGTKGVVGFASGKTHALNGVTFEVETPFSVVLITSLDPDKAIAEADRILVTTVARARNTGMKYSDDGTEVLEVGAAPILLEPVDLTLKLGRPGNPAVTVLDHAGRRTERRIAPRDGSLPLRGSETHAIYYEIAYE